jgi:hypothetical protein
MTKARSYIIEWDPRAEAELETLRVFDSRPIVQAVEELQHHAETRTRNRKPLDEPIAQLPEASWELRVGEHRVFYELRMRESSADSMTANDATTRKTVRVLRVILKGRQSTRTVVSKKP